jgi:hypothetical protein
MTGKIEKKHPCEDCEFCQFCSDSRCSMCRGIGDKKKKCREKGGYQSPRPVEGKKPF